MNYRQKHEKLIQILSETSFENFLESLSAIEYNLFLNSNEDSKCIVPLKADFQLPNVFLKTRKNFKVEKIFSNLGLKANWNKEVDMALEILDTIDLNTDQDCRVVDTDEKLLEKMIKCRYSNAH